MLFKNWNKNKKQKLSVKNEKFFLEIKWKIKQKL